MLGKTKPRSSVSAEAFGAWNQKSSFVPRVIAKSNETKSRILQRLSQAFMFSALDEREQTIVLDAMEERRVVAKQAVITQGEEGDNLYVVESGILVCEKTFAGKTMPTFLKKYQPGESFGELSLLYNAPRAATIWAEEESVLWSLDRQTFTHIVKDAACKKREKYELFLKEVKILQTMDAYERSKLADAFKEDTFAKGHYIIREGDVGDSFYFIELGEAVATKTLTPG